MSQRTRRTHIILLLVAISLVYLLFFSSESSTPSFRTRTESALTRPRRSPLHGDLSDEELQAATNAKLNQILDRASSPDEDSGSSGTSSGTSSSGGGGGGSSNGNGNSVVVLKGNRTPPSAPPASGGSTKAAQGGGKEEDKDKKSKNDNDGDDDRDEIPIAGRRTMPKTVKGGLPPTTGQQSQQEQQRQQQQDMMQKKQREQKQQAALKDPNDKPRYPKTSPSSQDGSDPNSSGEEDDPLLGSGGSASSDPGEVAARHELQSILKKAPIVIFSKSYCPYSRRAKQLLLHDYDIVPKPYVVELDELTDTLPTADDEDNDEANNDETKSKKKSAATTSITMGKKIQDLLNGLTGRSTVPNIMIASESLGGSDEIVKLHSQGKLADRIRRVAGKRIVSIEPVTAPGSG